jgi:hypothetical protein
MTAFTTLSRIPGRNFNLLDDDVVGPAIAEVVLAGEPIVLPLQDVADLHIPFIADVVQARRPIASVGGDELVQVRVRPAHRHVEKVVKRFERIVRKDEDSAPHERPHVLKSDPKSKDQA